MRTLVTGASGFIGGVLCRRLAERGAHVRVAVRKPGAATSSYESFLVGEIDGATDWTRALDGIDTVFHLAGRAHVMDSSKSSGPEFTAINVDGTEALARAAAALAGRSFVFMSSAKVYGDRDHGRPFREEDTPNPADAYSRSKLEAEQRIQDVHLIVFDRTADGNSAGGLIRAASIRDAPDSALGGPIFIEKNRVREKRIVPFDETARAGFSSDDDGAKRAERLG